MRTWARPDMPIFLWEKKGQAQTGSPIWPRASSGKHPFFHPILRLPFTQMVLPSGRHLRCPPLSLPNVWLTRAQSLNRGGGGSLPCTPIPACPKPTQTQTPQLCKPPRPPHQAFPSQTRGYPAKAFAGQGAGPCHGGAGVGVGPCHGGAGVPSGVSISSLQVR